MKPGDRFLSRVWIDPDAPPAERRPLVVQITRVTRSTIYYRPASGGTSAYIENTPAAISKWLGTKVAEV